MTYKEVLAKKLPTDLSGITNPHAFQWEKGKLTDVYYPVNFMLLSLCVYKSPLGECTNGGVSATAESVYIPCAEGPTKAFDIPQELILFPEQRSINYWALNPSYTPEGLIGPMSGGNLAYSCDSRCRMVYHIHDRFETPEQYRALSI